MGPQVSQDVYDGVPVSVYTPHKAPSSTPTQPTIIYFHGGGWTWLSVGKFARRLSMAGLAD